MNSTTRVGSAVALAALIFSAAGAHAQDVTPPVAPAGAAAPAFAPPTAAAPVVAPPTPAPRPFAEIVRGAKHQDGLFPIWRKDEKVWLEVPLAMIGKSFLFSANIANSIGERGLYASQMAASHMAQFRVVGRQVQLIALNTGFRAVADQGSKRAIEQAFSPSLLGSGPMASAEHPERKSVLIDASFLLSDIPGYSTRLEAAYRLPFVIDRANSSFERERADEKLSTLTARIHFATARIPAPPLTPSPVPLPTPPQSTPDPRSLFVDYVYSFLALPEKPMAVRQRDPRIGYFTESFTDLGGDLKANPRVHYIHRWRLEKKDPAAALSEPVQPIVYWLDKNIPVKYRPTIESGILEWNKAFERIGFKNAIVVKQQPDDADWDNMDAGHASIRWFVGADVGFAVGPIHSDPRTGEILDADIGMSDVFARGSRRSIVEEFGGKGEAFAMASSGWQKAGPAAYYCDDAHMSASEMDFALELLDAREELAPDSPEAEAFVMATIKGTIMHEVGHTLGLTHNFKASTTVTAAQLQDKSFTDANGIANSVMDYTPVNLALKGEKQGSYGRTTLGAYDYWAIEYAYRPLDAKTEAADLAKIASRSTEPQLAFGDDAEAGGPFGSDGMDPLTNRFDLGDNPLAYYKKRIKLSQELWARIQDRKPRPDEDPLRQRRSVLAGFNRLADVAELAAKYVGGMHAVRDLPASGRPSFKPVDPAQQRDALKFLASEIFSVDAFKFKPELLSSLTVDYTEWNRGGPVDITSVVGRVQLAALNRLMSPGTANRLLDLPSYVAPAQRKGLISLNEVYDTVQRSVWSELGTGGDIDRIRRNLQREHVRRLQVAFTRGAAGMPPDAMSLMRFNATRLESQLKTAVARGGRSVDSQAHLEESLGMLSEALHAKMQRS